MLERLSALKDEYRELEARLADPEILADQKRFVEMSRRYSSLDELMTLSDKLEGLEDDLNALGELMAEATEEDKQDLRKETANTEAEIEALKEQIKVLLLPKDHHDGKNVIVEIRGAEGGEEANLFARDLYEMYRAWATSKGWSFELLNYSNSDLGGLDEVTFMLKGGDAWAYMKFEAGPHRVQRVPVTESQGRVHTSSATVTVLPEAEEIDLAIDANDLRYDTYRSSGAGGQHVNTTDSAVRLTHLPSGLVVSMQDEKSQIQNRERALKVLRSRLLRLEEEKRMAEQSAARRDQTGGGGRSEKIRTYNFKENRVTDHRLSLTLHKLDRVLNGDLAEISDALLQDERTRQLQSGFQAD